MMWCSIDSSLSESQVSHVKRVQMKKTCPLSIGEEVFPDETGAVQQLSMFQVQMVSGKHSYFFLIIRILDETHVTVNWTKHSQLL
jgi:hypothetical protein